MNTLTLLEEPWGWTVRSTYPSGGHRGASFKTESEAKAFFDSLIDGPRCHECGDPIWSRNDARADAMLAERLCSTCFAWTHMTIDGEPAVVDGRHYIVGETEQAIARRCRFPMDNGRLRSDYRHVLGHAGARFVIAFHNGRRVETTNLWTQGIVPEHFRGRYPDNAVFVTGKDAA